MLRLSKNIYHRLNHMRPPEDSLPLRLSVLAGVLAAELSVLAMGYFEAAFNAAIPCLTVAGFALSWRWRRRRNLLLKTLLSVLVLAVTALFFGELVSSLPDARLPLLKLLLYLQMLHSFDLPARKNLKFSLASALTMMAAGAVLSTSTAFAAGLLLFSLFAVISLSLLHASELDVIAVNNLMRTRKIVNYSVGLWLLGLFLTFGLLIVIPQGNQARLRTLPISAWQSFLGNFSGAVINPFYDSGGNPFERPPQNNAGSYYGFNSYMDLRSRGNLGDQIVLKVKSASYDFYRGLVFDHYNGKGWEMESEEGRELAAASPPFELDLATSPVYHSQRQVQNFYVQEELPNIIFTSWRPVSLYFPVDRIKIDQNGSLRSPARLTDDTIYSAEIEAPRFGAAQLERFPRPGDPPVAPHYTELPQPLGAELAQVRQLAQEITEPYPGRYAKMLALDRYLKQNYRYDLGIAPQRQEMDAVAYFLFQEQSGYCEHFASALAVMARSLDIPSRVVTGYTGGSFNPFSGLWEVKENDAHAWVEIYFGAAGWVPFDPTPGFEFPGDGEQEPWRGTAIAAFLERTLGQGPIGDGLKAVGRSVGAVIAWLTALPWTLLATVLGAASLLLSGAVYLITRLWRFCRRRRLIMASLGPDFRREPLLKGYSGLAMQLKRYGFTRQPHETLRSFALRVNKSLGGGEFVRLSRMVEERRYGGLSQEDNPQEGWRPLVSDTLTRLRVWRQKR